MTCEIKMGQGVKRKLEDLELEKSPCNQRQSILNISVGKLQVKSVKRVEPPLLRSVLILNTLKHIETELLKEGVHSSNTSAFAIPEVDPNSTIIDFLPEQQNNSKMDDDVTEQSGPLPSIDTFVGVRATTEDRVKTSTESSAFASVTEASLATIYPTPLRMEEVLNDLDFTMCEYDMFSAVSGANKLTPLSADEVLHSCPNSSSTTFCTDTYTTLSNATLSPFCKSDQPFDDLENIMQILVGS